MEYIWSLDSVSEFNNMQYDVIMTPDYIIVSIKFYPEVENDQYIIVCNVSRRRISGFEVIGLLPGRRKQKRARSEG